MMKLLTKCWNPSAGTNAEGGGEWQKEGLLWYRDLGKCSCGEFSMAVVQANQVLEDQCHIESGGFGTFVGIYDGHGGPDAARYVCDTLHRNLLDNLLTSQNGTPTAIVNAFLQTEAEFTSIVSRMWNVRPQLATVGSCCLVGLVYQGTLFAANLGDSRVVLGTKVGNTGQIAAIQLSTEHNANEEAVRQELRSQHPNDPLIVVQRFGSWRVKGIIQVSRSIGDAYMKHAQFNREPIDMRFRIHEHMNMPILSANPSIISRQLHQNDAFLIFASDGLWEHLSNDQAVDIVHNSPHMGSAKRLVKAALREAARKREMRYSDLWNIDKRVRRHFHDDITVIILFINHDLLNKNSNVVTPVSIRSALDH